MKTLISLICFFWLFNISLAEEPFRTWTSWDADERFNENAEYLFRLGKYHALLGMVEEAKNLVRRVFKLDASFKAEFLDDLPFGSVWESF